ncbi:glycosyltransferase [Pseudochelatococcus lubricantis]|uniref:glycosyltransferase n=1 Tax=Pseudochelatococcus lubricantis TaxID=1538102 RepID=UPI0035E71225
MSEASNDVATLIAEADQERDSGNWSKAADYYDKALSLNGDLFHIWVQLGNVSKEAEQYERSITAYNRALEIDSQNPDLYMQLGHLAKRMGEMDVALEHYKTVKALYPTHPEIDNELVAVERFLIAEKVRGELSHEPVASYEARDTQASVKDTFERLGISSSGKIELVFDVSDLIQYFMNARLPTGIQRVQIEVVTDLIFNAPENVEIRVACFTKSSDTWLVLPPLFFNHICKLAVISGETTANDWIRVLEELKFHLDKADTLIFQQGAFLVNIGTSWWLQNYFLHIRHAKSRYNIKYVPYVHDCIPIMTPEHCVEGLTRDFITWALGVFQHADYFLVNSKSTAKDVTKVAAYLGYSVEEPRVITLDADYRSATRTSTSNQKSGDLIFNRTNIKKENYALFVSTIESRKNHFLAFNAWLRLAKRHGINNIPKLVCVGNKGWLNDAVYARLNSSDILKDRIVMLSKIPDQELEALYKNCLFTIYTSSYEGWGLPVTESLCYGKVPLISNVTSLPEAGGDFAVYFDPASEAELVQQLEALIFDHEFRRKTEEHIARDFSARPWRDIAAEFVSTLVSWHTASHQKVPMKVMFTSRGGLWPVPAAPSLFHSITENKETRIWPNMRSGEVFRQGDGWWWPEPWGTWTKPGVATLAFLAELPEGGGAKLFIQVKGMQGQRSRIQVTVASSIHQSVELAADEKKWISVDLTAKDIAGLPRGQDNRILVDVEFRANEFVNFSLNTNGEDHRIAAIGVCGFIYFADTDVVSRINFLESVMTNDLSRLTGRPRSNDYRPLLADTVV